MVVVVVNGPKTDKKFSVDDQGTKHLTAVKCDVKLQQLFSYSSSSLRDKVMYSYSLVIWMIYC